MSERLIEDIQRLKKEHDALILAHYYQDGPIQDLADACGDSLFLAQQGQNSRAPVVLLAGVVFMGESVKILSPEKTVLVPDLAAGCSLVHDSPADQFLKWRLKHPNALAVTYVNSSAEVKALSDVICTSSNAEKVIGSIPKDRQILFGPDQNLGRFLSKKLNRPMELWPGQCEVHVLFSVRRLFDMKQEHSDALVLAHPECEEPLLALADVVGSTSKLLQEAERQSHYRKFIVATEPGILHQMRRLRPDAEFIAAPVSPSCECNNCPYMKLNSLEKIHQALKNLSPRVELAPHLLQAAKAPLERMMDITAGRLPKWPEIFTPALDFPLSSLPPQIETKTF